MFYKNDILPKIKSHGSYPGLDDLIDDLAHTKWGIHPQVIQLISVFRCS